MKETSRQYKEQLKYKEMGKCIKCAEPIWKPISKTFCEYHHIWTREYYRKYMGVTKRNNNCKSYAKEK